MKSTLLRLLATVGVGVAGLTGLAAAGPLPGTPDEPGIKACADYSLSPPSVGTYDSATGALGFRIVMADNMCKNVTYTFVVVAVAGPTLPASGQAFTWQDVRPGDPSTNVYTINTIFASPPASVCVYATTTAHNGSIHDRAPDDATTCIPVAGVSASGMW